MSILTSIRQQAKAWQAPKAKAVSDYRPDLRYRVHESGAPAQSEPAIDTFVGAAAVYDVHTWVRKAVSMTAENVAPLSVRVVDADDAPVDKHPVSMLLSAGNDTMSPAQVWEAYTIAMLLGGESPLEIVPDKRGNPLWLWPRRPDKVLVHPDMTPERRLYPTVAEYTVMPDKEGDPVRIPVDSIIFDKFHNPINVWRGISPIAAVRNSIIIDVYAQAWSKKFLQSGARPDYALIAPQGITQTERERLEATLLSKYGGPDGWHKPVILEDGITDIKTFSFAPKDIEWLQQREFSRDEIAALFGVPDELMGFGKNTYENFETALTVFWTLTLQKFVTRRDTVLTHFFTVRRPMLQPGQRIATDLSGIGVLQEDKAPKVAMAKTLWDMGAPFNQLDEQLRLGIGPIPNGEFPNGKDPAAAEAMRQAIAGNGNRPPGNAPADDMADDDEDDNMDERDNGEKGAATAHGFFTKRVNGLTRDMWLNAKALVLQTVPGDDDAEEELRSDLERQAEDAIIAGFRQQRRAMIPRNARGMELDALLAAILGGVGLSVALHDAITRTVLNGADLGVNIAVDQLATVGVGFDYTLVNQAAREWAERYSSTLIRDIDDHTLQYVRQTVARWYENGESLPALVRDLEPIFGEYRARMIAETETTRSAAEGALRGYRDSGVVASMEWATALDERVCSICGSLHGTQVGLSDSFWDTLDADLQQRYRRTFQTPPAHPRCRCRLKPVVITNG